MSSDCACALSRTTCLLEQIFAESFESKSATAKHLGKWLGASGDGPGGGHALEGIAYDASWL